MSTTIVISKQVDMQRLINEFVVAGIPIVSCKFQEEIVLDTSNIAQAQAIYDLHPNYTVNELATNARADGAKAMAANIPDWYKWTPEQALTWGQNNIVTPLANGRANLPASLTLTSARLAIVGILDVLDAMWVMLWALARMVIALRNKNWPDLPES